MRILNGGCSGKRDEILRKRRNDGMKENREKRAGRDGKDGEKGNGGTEEEEEEEEEETVGWKVKERQRGREGEPL